MLLLSLKSNVLSAEQRKKVVSIRSAETRNAGIIVSMAVIHISEGEAARDLPGLLARVRAGTEIIIESDTQPAAVLRAAAPPRRSISESIALAEARTKELGYKPVMDAGFAADLEEIIRNRKPRDTSAWD
jgi:antitoxin (DNA-binding transcriptional repressor) of toxin-antitoxin stability system